VYLRLLLTELSPASYLGGNGTSNTAPDEKYIANMTRLILTEGIFTILLGVFAYFFLPDCEHSSHHNDKRKANPTQFHPHLPGFLIKNKLSFKPVFPVIPHEQPRPTSISKSSSQRSRTSEFGCFFFAGPSSPLAPQGFLSISQQSLPILDSRE
jgi:hypothetical protein